MRKFLATILEKVVEKLRKHEIPEEVLNEKGEGAVVPPPLSIRQETREPQQAIEVAESEQSELVEEATPIAVEKAVSPIHKEAEKKRKQKKTQEKENIENELIFPTNSTDIVDFGLIRDVMSVMDVPMLALSKNRTEPLIYESPDKQKKIVVSGHRDHFIASIYDWDIILVVAGKLQEILNDVSDFPSRTITIPRHELLTALHKHDGKKQQDDLEKSLTRLKTTLIDMTAGTDRYQGGFIESWEYKERDSKRGKQIIRITLSEWLYNFCCAKGGLLKTDSRYFALTSGLQRFLYRTARRHAGNNRDGWTFSIETLYEKSGSESDLRKFKEKLKQAVRENDIPEYSLKWITKNRKHFVLFKNKKMQTIEERMEEFEEKHGPIKELEILSTT